MKVKINEITLPVSDINRVLEQLTVPNGMRIEKAKIILGLGMFKHSAYEVEASLLVGFVSSIDIPGERVCKTDLYDMPLGQYHAGETQKKTLSLFDHEFEFINSISDYYSREHSILLNEKRLAERA